MSRVSQLELYNDKDVITQILLMKEEVETGTYAEVRIIETGGNYVFEFEDQQGNVQTFTVPAKQISGVTSSQSGSTVTMRINYNDGTHQDVTWTAGGDVTTNTAQTISAVKTFTVSPLVPTPPPGSTDQTVPNTNWISQTGNGGPNNLIHKTGDETKSGLLTLKQSPDYSFPRMVGNGTSDGVKWMKICKLNGFSSGQIMPILVMFERGFFLIHLTAYGSINNTTLYTVFIGARNSNQTYNDVAIYKDSDDELYLCVNIKTYNMHVGMSVLGFKNFGTVQTTSPYDARITPLGELIDDISAYTLMVSSSDGSLIA